VPTIFVIAGKKVGLDGSKMDAILIGSSRSKGLDCIFVVSKCELSSKEAKQ
jgi:hypothetical protein